MFTITINAADFGNNPETIARFMQEVQSHLPQSTGRIKSKESNDEQDGPLAEHWMNLTKRRIRRTEGRSAEAQAEHNLRTYRGYTDEDIFAVQDGSFVQVSVDSSENDDTVEEETETLTEKDLF